MILENMHNHIAKINQNPGAAAKTLDMMCRHTVFFQPVQDFFRNGFDSDCGFAAADHKEIGNVGKLSQVQQHNIIALFFVGYQSHLFRY